MRKLNIVIIVILSLVLLSYVFYDRYLDNPVDSYTSCYSQEQIDISKLEFCHKEKVLEIKDEYFINLNNKKQLYYYISIKSEPKYWEENNILGIDDNKIVYVNYGEKIGKQYNPLTIAQYALSNFNKYIDTNDKKYKDIFFKQVDYLINNYDIIDNNNIGWAYLFEYKSYDLEKGWYSGLAQGQIISVLVRAYLLSNNSEYLPIINKAMNFMLKELKDNKEGLLRYTPEGNIWIEEYPSKKPSLVLNGFVSSIFGMYDYLIIFPNEEKIKNIYSKSLVSLKNSIAFYDTGSWLLYDRYHKTYINNNYMEFQTNQMLQLYINTNDKFFLEMYEKYSNYSMHDDYLYIIQKLKSKFKQIINN